MSDTVMDSVKVLHRLSGTERTDLITPIAARIRNRTRDDKKTWVALTPEELIQLTEAQATQPPECESEQIPAVAQEGISLRKDDDMAKVTKKVVKAKAEKPEPTRSRPKWNGHSMVALVRLAGSLGYSYGKTCAIIDELGLKHSTIRTNWTYGKKGGKEGCEIPELSATHLKEFKSIAHGITEEEAAKAEKKTNDAAGEVTPKNPRKANTEKPAKVATKKATKAEPAPKKKKVKKAKAKIVDDTDGDTAEEEETESAPAKIVDDTEEAEVEAELVEV